MYRTVCLAVSCRGLVTSTQTHTHHDTGAVPWVARGLWDGVRHTSCLWPNTTPAFSDVWIGLGHHWCGVGACRAVGSVDFGPGLGTCLLFLVEGFYGPV